MSTTIETNVVDAFGASPLPYDFFREVHKGLRSALYGLTVTVGSADYRCDAARDEVIARVHDTVALLHAHHGHEDAFIKPLLEHHTPVLARIVDAGHQETECDLIEIELLTDRLVGVTGGEAVVAGLALYHYLALFTARYVAHMALEEGEVMATLRDAMAVSELFGVDMALRSAVAPEKMCAFIAVMVPAMNIEERTSMLGGMQAGAPPEIFEVFRSAAEAALGADDYGDVAARLGLA
jgi:hypothetical protein